MTVLLLGAGCGGGSGSGSGHEASGQTVTAPLYTFQAPSDWKATVSGPNAIVKKEPDTLVSATVLPTVKVYRPKLFPRLVGELDRVTGTFAERLQGRVTAKKTMLVAGGRVRQYQVTHDDIVDQLTFVFRGKQEFLLTCRWRTKDGRPDACDQQTSTFRLR